MDFAYGMPGNAKNLVIELLSAVLNGGDLARVGELVASTFHDHHPWPGQPGTLAGFLAGLAEYREACPDAHFDLEHLEVDGEIVSALVTRTGTHLGGQRFRLQVLEMLRIAGGRIVERWGFLDEEIIGREHVLGSPNAVFADHRLFMLRGTGTE